MTIYPGTRIEQEYAHGLDEGHADGARDLESVLGLTHDVLWAARTDVRVAWNREERAFRLGFLRGYREVVRTLRNGRWGT